MAGQLKFIDFMENSSDFWCVVDTNFHYLYANQVFRDLLRLPRDFEVEGLRLGQLPHPAAEFEKELTEFDRVVQTTKETLQSVQIHPMGKDQRLSAYYFDDSPLFNEKNEVIGSVTHACPARNLRFHQDRVKPGVIILGVPDDTLSKKEWDFVYFAMRGYSTKEMARLSGVAPVTISARQTTIFNKLGIDTLAQLKQMGMANGWDNFIPTDLIGNRLTRL